MSIYINKVILQGRISNDPKIESTAGGTCKATCHIATTRYRKDKNTGERIEDTTFNRVVAYGATAELIANYAFKGKEVYIEGILETRSWDDQQSGQKQFITEVVVDDLRLGADPKGQGQNTQQGYQQQAPQQGYQQQPQPRQQNQRTNQRNTQPNQGKNNYQKQGHGSQPQGNFNPGF